MRKGLFLEQYIMAHLQNLIVLKKVDFAPASLLESIGIKDLINKVMMEVIGIRYAVILSLK